MGTPLELLWTKGTWDGRDTATLGSGVGAELEHLMKWDQAHMRWQEQ